MGHMNVLRNIPRSVPTATLSRREVLQCLAMIGGTWGLRSSARADEPTTPLERVVAKPKAEEITLLGKVLVEDQSGGVVLLGQDGHWWSLPTEILVSREVFPGQTFRPLTAVELGDSLQREQGAGFNVVIAEPYVICTNASRPYAEWCGQLLKRLREGFEKFWKKDELPFAELEFPLPVLVFSSRKQFAQYALETADAATAVSFGYYSIEFNRVAVFDLMEGQQGRAPRSAEEVNTRLQDSLANVANLVHEATHQIAYNAGLHTRFADNPLWMAEGMALFFEVPDLRSKTGWATMGRVNSGQLRAFANYVRGGRPADSLKTLIRTDDRFTSADTAGAAYAEAWGLTYYLIKRRREEYTAYLRHTASKKMLVFLDGDQRQAEFERFFGEDWDKLDKEFLTYLRRAR